MKLRIASTLSPAILILSLAAGRAQPLARVTISSFGDLSNAVLRVAGAVSPDSQKDLGGKLTGSLGLTNLATFDEKGAWEIAVWQQSGSPPLVAVKGPIGDAKKFQRELNPEGLLAAMGKDWVQLEKGSGVIVFKAADTQTEAEKEELKLWESERIAPPRRTVELTVVPNEAARAQVLPLLAMGRMSMSQVAAAAAGGANPKATGEMFNLYFDALEGLVQGFQEFKLAAGTDADSLVLEETIAAKPGTDLAKWIQKPANPLTVEDIKAVTRDIKAVTRDALFSGAVTVGKDARLIELAQKFLRVSLEMQNQPTNGAAMSDWMDLIGKCLPVRLSGSVNMKGHLEFSGAYRFPGADAATVYAQMKPLMARLAKSQAGQGKLYAAASFTEKHHMAGSVAVDRFACTLNLDNPLYQQPGQQEQMKAMFPNGKLEFDYAVKDGQLLAATPERMQALIDGSAKPAGESALVPDESTVAAGYFNLLSALRDLSGANPAIPAPVKERLGKLEPKGTALRFQLKMDTQVHGEQHVPLKFLEQIGRLKDES